MIAQIKKIAIMTSIITFFSQEENFAPELFYPMLNPAILQKNIAKMYVSILKSSYIVY